MSPTSDSVTDDLALPSFSNVTAGLTSNLLFCTSITFQPRFPRSPLNVTLKLAVLEYIYLVRRWILQTNLRVLPLLVALVGLLVTKATFPDSFHFNYVGIAKTRPLPEAALVFHLTPR